MFAGQQLQASGIIVDALSDHTLCTVSTVIGIPSDMTETLDSHYDSKSMHSKISKMVGLVCARYSILKHDIAKHFKRVAVILKKIKGMEGNLNEPLTVEILIASVVLSEMAPFSPKLRRCLIWK